MKKDDSRDFIMDFISLLSFMIGLENLDKNDEQIKSLEEHLTKQDEQYEKIISLLNDIKSNEE